MIDLPANIVWPTPTLGVAIVQGDQCARQHTAGPTTIYVHHHAPRQWAQYDKPCETCEQTGIVDAWVNGPGDVTLRRCPDCRDGRQVWTVRWLCDCDAGTNDGTHADDCLFDDDGYLSARATIQVVPVAVNRPDRCDCWVATGFDPSNAAALITVGQPAILLPLDPLPVPNRHWVVVVLKAAA